jgi:hypothetical protein
MSGGGPSSPRSVAASNLIQIELSWAAQPGAGMAGTTVWKVVPGQALKMVTDGDAAAPGTKLSCQVKVTGHQRRKPGPSGPGGSPVQTRRVSDWTDQH